MRKLFKKLHLYLALFLCLPLVLQGLTGTILTFQHEISDAILRQKYVFAEGEKSSEDALIVAGTTAVPAEFIFQRIKISTTASLRFSKNGEKKEWLEVLLDPVSAQLIEVRNPNQTFFNIIKRLHVHLLIPGPIGKNIVGVLGVVMLFMCISGLIIWWPKQGFLKRALTFKFSSTGKKFHRDLHGAVGFWTLIPFMVVGVTGIYLIYFRTKESNKLWHALHEGSVGGLAWQSTVFVVGFLPLLFSITGILLWCLKKRDRKTPKMETN